MFLRIIFALLSRVDNFFCVRFLSYEKYFNLHRSLGFPLVKLLFYKANGYPLNLSNPQSFNEKLIYDKLNNRPDLYPIITDKYKARLYVENKIGAEYLIPLIGAYDELNMDVLGSITEKCIIKTNHGSHQHFIINDPQSIDYKLIISESNKWLNNKYRFQALAWFVQKIPRKIVIEKLMVDEEGKVPFDYKFFVFSGKVKFIQVDADRFSGHHRILYDKNWNKINVDYLVDSGGKNVVSPVNLNLMISLAEKLGANFNFMRVDLYDNNGKVYFGELTPYPSAGYGPFKPTSYDIDLGDEFKIKQDI